MSTAPRPAPRHRLLTALTAASVLFSAAALPATAGSFEAKGRDFLLDGKPIQILSGEIHYPRVPRPYWQDRLRKAKAMGLNTICTYLFWNLHEPQPGRWDFADNLDFVAFLKACQAEGLHAIVRPGPYVCAEWELGGYPAWLLADPQTKLRATDPRFLKPAVAYLEKVSAMLKPLQVENGGPVLMVQVENEYGSFEDDRPSSRLTRTRSAAAASPAPCSPPTARTQRTCAPAPWTASPPPSTSATTPATPSSPWNGSVPARSA